LGFFSSLKKLVKRVIHAAIHAAFTFLTTLIFTGSVHAAFVAGIADFFKELGFPSKGWYPGSPQWNPNATPILGGGASVSRSIIVNFRGSGLPDCSTGAVPCEAGGLIVTNTGARRPWYKSIWSGIRSGVGTVVGGISVSLALSSIYYQRYNVWMQGQTDRFMQRMAENSIIRGQTVTLRDGRTIKTPDMMIAIPAAGGLEEDFLLPSNAGTFTNAEAAFSHLEDFME